MRRVLIIGFGLSLAACAGGGKQAGGEMTLNLADVAGHWTLPNTAEGSDSVIVTAEINATANTEGWTLVLPGRDTIPLTVMTSGDSIMAHGGPYESVLRPGVQVTVETVMHLVNNELLATTVAHYQGAGADSVLRLQARGTRTQ